ncbi:DM13 domain-containing protein [Lutibacter sp. A80]|uniref:DM13 domain-containing protein n=1 Tax=Lutibacter sp. A80 TaxID=2918453 RepID=UPI001F060DC3|nr:DM13 domain-containing protein [Lutibacter sp. A80]UMB60240.1 DM13 domain-containing protein [Lutibacter sp. A80]
MKKIVVLMLFVITFSNCSENNDEMDVIEVRIENEENNLNEENTTNEPTLIMGDFIDGAHPTSGKASVNSEKSVLSFSNFKTDSGPKLLVYLTTDVNASEYIDLGDLKGISGDFTYNIPKNTDISKYNIVNIWCVDFSVSFGTAVLK